MNESILLPPDSDEPQGFQKELEISNKVKADLSDINKFSSKGETVKLKFETGGRFLTPPVLHFEDYSTRQVSHLTMARHEDLTETLITILTENCIEKFPVENLLIEEFMEVLIGMWTQFYPDNDFTHRWYCTCQNSIPNDKKKMSKQVIDLNKLNYTSIEVIEEKMREQVRAALTAMSVEQLAGYKNRIGAKDDATIDSLVENWQAKEPIAQYIGNDLYEFVFPRIGDIVRAFKMVSPKYEAQIRRVRAKQMHGVPEADAELIREKEIEDLLHKKQLDVVSATRGLTLVRKNGRDLSPEQRVKEYGDIKRRHLFNHIEYMKQWTFGLNHEHETVCDLCGKTERGLLQHKLNFVELLPFALDSESNSAREYGKVAQALIVM